jgi:hypothetical protein
MARPDQGGGEDEVREAEDATYSRPACVMLMPASVSILPTNWFDSAEGLQRAIQNTPPKGSLVWSVTKVRLKLFSSYQAGFGLGEMTY